MGADAQRCSSKRRELLAGPWRDTVNAATMLNQSKTVYQAEIDSPPARWIDFWRFNPHYMHQIYTEQPGSVRRNVEPPRVPRA